MQLAQNTKTISFLPNEMLLLAISHEYRELQRYRLMALRFLPFNTGISRLMKMLTLEAEQRLEEFAHAAERLQLGRLPASVPPRDERTRDRHFFIINERMASQALAQAVIGEHQSLHFYRQLLEANGTPELHALIAACIEQKLAQGRVLQESQEQLLLVDPSLRYRRSA